MSDVYAAFGPLPSSVGVTPSPTPPEEDRRYANLHLYSNLPPGGLSSPHTDDETLHRTATLGVRRSVRHRHKEVARSHQDLRRTISRAALERAPEPLQLLERLDHLDSTAERLRGSLQKIDTPSPLFFDRRRNGSAVSGVSSGYHDPPCSVHYSASRRNSREQLEIEEDDEAHKCCLQTTYCKVFCSILVCIIILAGVIAALYFFITRTYYNT